MRTFSPSFSLDTDWREPIASTRPSSTPRAPVKKSPLKIVFSCPEIFAPRRALTCALKTCVSEGGEGG